MELHGQTIFCIFTLNFFYIHHVIYDYLSQFSRISNKVNFYIPLLYQIVFKIETPCIKINNEMFRHENTQHLSPFCQFTLFRKYIILRFTQRLFNNRKVGFCYADLIRKCFFLKVILSTYCFWSRIPYGLF